MTTNFSALKNFALCFLVICVTQSANGSQEGGLPLSNFRVESNGIGESGKIIIQGKQNEKDRVVELKITAFGKDYVVPSKELEGLAKLRPNGIRISYEPGYKKLGGKTLYIQFQVGWTSQTAQTALIKVLETGKIEIGGVQSPTKP